MKQKIQNRYTGKTQFVAEIDCDDNTPLPLKLRLAVLWAIKNKVDLSRADLSGADLNRTKLSGANLSRTLLIRANLIGANLNGANLIGANLSKTNLSRANLSETNMSKTDLSGANMRKADLSEADLGEANLRYYNSDLYECFIQTEYMQIGCELYALEWLATLNKENRKRGET